MKSKLPHDLVNVAVFDDYMDANMTKAELEVYGVKSYLLEENYSAVLPLNNYRILRLYLAVHESDKAEAEKLIAKLRKGEVPGE